MHRKNRNEINSTRSGVYSTTAEIPEKLVSPLRSSIKARRTTSRSNLKQLHARIPDFEHFPAEQRDTPGDKNNRSWGTYDKAVKFQISGKFPVAARSSARAPRNNGRQFISLTFPKLGAMCSTAQLPGRFSAWPRNVISPRSEKMKQKTREWRKR